jgi:hypothetical protein
MKTPTGAPPPEPAPASEPATTRWVRARQRLVAMLQRLAARIEQIFDVVR